MDTKLFARRQPGGMLMVGDAAELLGGNVWWVGSGVTGATNSASYGQNPEAPFATLVYAETRASTDDTIYVLPNHSETLLSTAGAAVLTLDVAGLRVIGLGNYSRKPTFLIDGHANNYVSVTGADTLIENVQFSAGHADVAKAVLTAGDGITFRKVDFIENTSGENFKIGISVGAADNDSDGLTVEHCRFLMPDAANTQAVLINKNQDQITIHRNYIHGDFAAGYIIGAPNTEVLTNFVMTENLIDNDANDTVCVLSISTAAGCNGIAANNCSGDIDGDGTPYIFTGGSLVNNYHTGAITKSGFLYPAADS